MIKYLETEEEFEKAIKSDVVVDFYADWCGPCKMFAKIAEEIDFIDILKVNVDEHKEIAEGFNIMSIPTLCYFKKGKIAKKVVGCQTVEEVKETIKKL